MNATPRTDAALEWVRPAGNDCGPPNEQYVCADFARELERELAIERARLDWLESDAGVDWQWSDAARTVSRASIDAFMKEGAK